MNYFYVDEDAITAARMLCDQHVIKMISETGQMLSTAHRVLETPQADFVYKATHTNHPSTKWLRSSQIAYKHGLHHLRGLLLEYQHRFNKPDKFERLRHEVLPKLMNIPEALPVMPFVEPPQCVYDECKGPDTVAAYRDYYRMRRNEIDMRWTNREIPAWL